MIEEASLKNALLSVMEHQVRQFPEPSEQDRRIARRLRPRIKRMIERKESPFTFYAKRIAALLVLLLGITGTMLLCFNESVRAGVTRWFQDLVLGDDYRYINQSGEQADITLYSLQGKVPPNYQLFESITDEEEINEIYVNEAGDILSFTVMSPSYEGELYIVSDAEKHQVCVGRFQADVYISNDVSEGSEIVWKGEKDILFIIQGFLTEKELVKLAERIR